jgi:uncharacterized membrane protein
MLEALEYTAIILAPVFLGAIGFLIGLVVFNHVLSKYLRRNERK